MSFAGISKVRKVVTFSGFCGGVDIGVHNNTIVNGARGLLERVLRYRNPAGALEELPRVQVPGPIMQRFTAQLLAGVRTVTPWSVGDFINTYTGRQRALYEAAARSLDSKPLEPRDGWVGPSFVKAEKINFSAKSDPAPRIIQPRTPRYNIAVGVFLKRIEKLVYKAIAEVFGGPTVIKGYTPQETAHQLRCMWDQFHDPVAIGLDASRFDQHVRPELLEWEHSVYLSWFRGQHARTLKRLLQWQVKNRGMLRCSDGRVKYTVDGCRMSGDMNTSLGNCLIMCALVWTFCHERGIKCRLANNGDDCIVVCDRSDEQKFKGLTEWFLRYGFRMKVEQAVYRFEHVEFCQTRPIWDGEVWTMCRDPRVAVSKDLVITDPSMGHGVGLLKWMHAVGTCGLAGSGGLPIFDALYAALAAQGVEGSVCNSLAFRGKLKQMSVGSNRTGKNVTDEARVSFYEAFGISPTMQRTWEDEIRSNWVLPRHPGKLQPHGSVDRGPFIS